MPATVAAGDLLIFYSRAAGAQTIASVTGFTFLVDDDSSDASDDNTCIMYRWADGTEGATISVSLSASAKGTVWVARITGAINPATQPPEITAPTVTTAANVDPPAITPTGGSKDYLFIVFGGMDGEGVTFTAGTPAGYSTVGGGNINSGTGGAVATNCVTSVARKAATAASENPGVWTSSAPATGCSAWTMAVHPPAAATTYITRDPWPWLQAVNRASVW